MRDLGQLHRQARPQRSPTSTRGERDVPAVIAEHARSIGAGAVPISSRLEAEAARARRRGRRPSCAVELGVAGSRPPARRPRRLLAARADSPSSPREKPSRHNPGICAWA
jgi:hypothetical protein